jgi:hypothetical protein
MLVIGMFVPAVWYRIHPKTIATLTHIHLVVFFNLASTFFSNCITYALYLPFHSEAATRTTTKKSTGMGATNLGPAGIILLSIKVSVPLSSPPIFLLIPHRVSLRCSPPISLYIPHPYPSTFLTTHVRHYYVIHHWSSQCHAVLQQQQQYMQGPPQQQQQGYGFAPEYAPEYTAGNFFQPLFSNQSSRCLVGWSTYERGVEVYVRGGYL